MGTNVRGEGRWGDYTAVAPGGLAPAGGTGSNPVMYFAGMFARGDGTWGTAIGRQEWLYRHHPTVARRSSKLKPRRERAASAIVLIRASTS